MAHIFSRLMRIGGQGSTTIEPTDISNLLIWLRAYAVHPDYTDGAALPQIEDESGNGYHFVQSDITKQPIIHDSGGVVWIEFDGSNDILQSISTITAKATLTVFILTKSGDTGSKYVLGGGNNTHAWIRGNHAGKWEFFQTPNTIIGDISTTIYQTIKDVTGSSAAGNWTLGALHPSYAHELVQEVIVYSRVLNAAELAQVDTYCASSRARIARTTKLVLPALLFDNGYGTLYGYYYRNSPLSRLVLTTSGTQLKVVGVTTIYNTYPSMSELGVFIDGAHATSLMFTANGEKTFTYTMPAGAKTVEIWTSGNTGSTMNGSFVKEVEVTDAEFSISTPSASNRIVAYGDSTTVGYGATDPIKEGVWTLVRLAYGDSVMLEAVGGKTLKTDCADATARTAFATKIASYSPAIIWLAIGTNDYGTPGVWSAADFGTAYADMLDKLHAALPDAVIYAQTPITRTVETANGYGNTLDDYRAQIATAQSTRSDYCTLVNGPTWTIALYDTVHPNTVGYAAYAAGIKTVLGIS